MDPPSPPPLSTTNTTATPPDFPSSPPKLRLMCSYGGHIVPRPQNKSLFYSGGETRIIALDRRTNAASLSALTSHLSRTLFNNRPFHLKFQLPKEDLDTLVSVINEEDFQNMLEEHDRVSRSVEPTCSRIRLFLFPVKPESLGSVLVDRKSDSWFSDALNNTGIIQRGQPVDTGLDTIGGSDHNAKLPAQADDSEKSGSDAGGGNGGEPKVVDGMPETLETSSSSGSPNSLVSMSNLAPIGVELEGDSVGLLEKRVRVASSASIERDNNVGGANFTSKKEIHQEQLIKVASAVPSIKDEIENHLTDPPSTISLQKEIQVSGYYLPPQSDGKHLQYELPYAQGGLQPMNQYPTGPMPLFSYHPMYPVHQMQSPYLLNQPYPIYLVPVRPNPNSNMSTEGSLTDNANVEVSRTPLHSLNAAVHTLRPYKEVMNGQQMPESLMTTDQPLSSTTPVVLAPVFQTKEQLPDPSERSHPSQTVAAAYVPAMSGVSEFNNHLARPHVYQTQPPAPAFPPQSQTSKEMNELPSEYCTNKQTASHSQTSLYAQ